MLTNEFYSKSTLSNYIFIFFQNNRMYQPYPVHLHTQTDKLVKNIPMFARGKRKKLLLLDQLIRIEEKKKKFIFFFEMRISEPRAPLFEAFSPQCFNQNLLYSFENKRAAKKLSCSQHCIKKLIWTSARHRNLFYH